MGRCDRSPQEARRTLVCVSHSPRRKDRWMQRISISRCSTPGIAATQRLTRNCFRRMEASSALTEAPGPARRKLNRTSRRSSPTIRQRAMSGRSRARAPPRIRLRAPQRRCRHGPSGRDAHQAQAQRDPDHAHFGHNGELQIELFQNTPARFDGRPEEAKKLTEELEAEAAALV